MPCNAMQCVAMYCAALQLEKRQVTSIVTGNRNGGVAAFGRKDERLWEQDRPWMGFFSRRLTAPLTEVNRGSGERGRGSMCTSVPVSVAKKRHDTSRAVLVGERT